MRSRRLRVLQWTALAVGLATVATIGFVYLSGLVASPQRHADGEGPLASWDGLGGGEMAVDPGLAHASVTSWTYGMRLCRAQGGASPVINWVGPTKSAGRGYRFLGAEIRQFVPTAGDTPIIAVENFPPPISIVPDVLHGVYGFAVTTQCSNNPHAAYTELLIGMGIVGADGGGWKGVDVHYHVGGKPRVLAIDYNILICGKAVEADCNRRS